MSNRMRISLADVGLLCGLTVAGGLFVVAAVHVPGPAKVSSEARYDQAADFLVNEVQFKYGGRCLVQPALRFATGTFRDDWGDRGEAMVIRGTLFVAAPAVEQGGGVLHLEHWAPVRMDWGPADPDGPSWCTGGMTTLRRHLTAVQGIVVKTRGGPADGALVSVCGQAMVAGSDGRFQAVVPPGRCTLSASRRDGWTVQSSEDVTVQIPPGEVVKRNLFVPVLRSGGVAVEASRGQ